MRVELAYGTKGLTIDLPPDRTTVIEPAYPTPLPKPEAAILNALRNPIDSLPLRQLVHGSQSVAISVCDVTRPVPTATILPVLLSELSHVPNDRITILVATGTHRSNSREELERMLGPEIVRDYPVICHNGFDPDSLVPAAPPIDGVPVFLNRRWVESDIRITLGLVEPHFFAGFSGGPKMVAPGLAGVDTIMKLHSAPLIGHPDATWAVTEGNPVHDAIRRIARDTGVSFSIDVTVDDAHRITSVHAGELFAEHAFACAFARSVAMRPTPQPFDVVITTNSGYPLDLNLYQAVKGLSAAAQVVKPGGSIICAAECRDGIPDHGDYKSLLTSRQTPADLLSMVEAPGFSRQDQWQVQIQARIQLKANVYLKSDYLTPEQIEAAHIHPVSDLQAAVDEVTDSYGPEATVCVLPQGPQTIAYVDQLMPAGVSA